MEATRLSPPTPGYDPSQHLQTAAQRNLTQVLNAMMAKPSWMTGARTTKGLIGTGIVAGFALTARGFLRQQKRISSLEHNQATILGYVQALIDQTNCGEDAYIYLQLQAGELDVDEKPKPEEEAKKEDEESKPLHTRTSTPVVNGSQE